MGTKIRIKFYESRWYLWLWRAKIVICWVVGHNWHGLPIGDGSFKYNYFCKRCMKFVTTTRKTKER